MKFESKRAALLLDSNVTSQQSLKRELRIVHCAVDCSSLLKKLNVILTGNEELSCLSLYCPNKNSERRVPIRSLLVDVEIMQSVILLEAALAQKEFSSN